jgi:hypothetical protein
MKLKIYKEEPVNIFSDTYIYSVLIEQDYTFFNQIWWRNKITIFKK